MNHTTNPIDAKIEPQIALIVVNFFDSFSDVISACKGDFQAFSNNVHDLLASIHARLSVGCKRIMENSIYSSKKSKFNA